MKRTSVYIISLLLLFFIEGMPVFSQDTIDMPLKIRFGLEVTGPAIWFAEKKVLNTEAFFSADLNEKRSIILGAGYVDYQYSQYNYDFKSKGFFARTGIDFNLMSPLKTKGIYWGGIGLHYGISRYKNETPFFQKENYWGNAASSLGTRSGWAHYFEIAPGVRAEVLKNFSLGWTISLRALLYSGSDKNTRPIYLPGFGNSATNFTSGMTYYIVWNIPYKRIKVIIKPEEKEETDGTEPLPGTAQPGSQF